MTYYLLWMDSDGRGGRGERKRKKRLQNALKVTHSESSLWLGNKWDLRVRKWKKKDSVLEEMRSTESATIHSTHFTGLPKRLTLSERSPESKRGSTISPWLMSWGHASFRRPAVFLLLIHDTMQHGTF